MNYPHFGDDPPPPPAAPAAPLPPPTASVSAAKSDTQHLVLIGVALLSFALIAMRPKS